MSTQLDFQMGMAKETGGYGIPAVASRFYDSEAKGTYDITRKDAAVLRPTKRVTRINRTAVMRKEGTVSVEGEVPTRGFGMLLNSVLGKVTNTVVPTVTPTRYQQVHSLATDDPVDSYTIQEVIPLLGGGTGQPHTFVGCVGSQLDFNAKEGDYLNYAASFMAKDMLTSQAAAAASYPADDSLFTFVHGSIGHAGTLTTPTATALGALSGTAAANVVDFSTSIKIGLDSKGFNLGGAGKRSRKNVLGKAEITGTMTVEYTDNVLRDAYLSQTPLPLVKTFLHDDGVSVLQIVEPCILLNGEIPKSNGGEPVTMTMPYTAYDSLVAAELPIFVVLRTLDTTV